MSETAQHTPGPWEADNNEGYSIWTIRSLTGTVATVHGDSLETDCNAWLIAEAPEMAALLREIAQLPLLLDGTDRSAAVITDDLRRRIHEVLLKVNGMDRQSFRALCFAGATRPTP